MGYRYSLLFEEYDNDPENPNAPRKSAYDSAIFIPLRKANTTIRNMKQPPPDSPDFLGVKLPSESGLPSEAGDTRRRSKASVDLLRNPFGEDEEDDNDPEYPRQLLGDDKKRFDTMIEIDECTRESHPTGCFTCRLLLKFTSGREHKVASGDVIAKDDMYAVSLLFCLRD